MNTETFASNSAPVRLVRFDGKIVALSELTGAQIASVLPASRKAEIRAALGINSVNPKRRASSSKDRTAVVVDALANDETCKGKADIALMMLADDEFAGLSGNAIVKLIGHAGSSTGDAESAARADMRAAIASNRGEGTCADPEASNVDALWDRARLANHGSK